MNHAAAVVPSASDVDPAGWLDRFDDMFARVVAPAFFRREPRLWAQEYLLGLVAGLERANGWTLAEFAGDATPGGMQRLLNAARWDEGAVRDALVRYVAAELGNPGGVLIADEIGFEKSGSCSAEDAAAVHGHGGEDHELPNRGVPGLRRARGRQPGAGTGSCTCVRWGARGPVRLDNEAGQVLTTGAD